MVYAVEEEQKARDAAPQATGSIEDGTPVEPETSATSDQVVRPKGNRPFMAIPKLD